MPVLQQAPLPGDAERQGANGEILPPVREGGEVAEEAMSTAEDIREDGKRQDAEERMPAPPEPCGCQWLSECCGAPPMLGAKDPVDDAFSICADCWEYVGFDSSDENTWKFRGQSTYGDDADGRRGVPLRAWECRECGQEVEVVG